MAGLLTIFAVQSKGETIHDPDLGDGGIWVTSSKLAKFARLNKPVGQFDAGVATNFAPSSALDIVQDGNAVAGVSLATNQLLPVDPRTGLLAENASATVPAPSDDINLDVFEAPTVDMRGGTIATVDPKTGKVWAQRVDTRAGVSSLEGLAAAAKPLATVGPVAAMAVDQSGTVHAVSGATGTVMTLAPSTDGFAPPVTERIKLSTKAVDITAVGDRWVVYNPVSDEMWAKGESDPQQAGVQHDEGHPAYAALQQPGPDRDSVALESAQGVDLVGLGGGAGDNGGVQIQERFDSTAAHPLVSRPIVQGNCVHGAWAAMTRAFYGANCGAKDPVGAVTIEKLGDEPLRQGVALRQNRGLIVLNDLDGGGLWDLDSKPIKIDNWDALLPPPQVDKNNKNKDKNVIDETQLQQPPKAEPDNLKARAGRTSKLHPLDNDTDTTGAILAIAPGDLKGPYPEGVSANVSADGQSVDVTIPQDPKFTSFKFKYKVNNGTAAAKSETTVTLTIAPETENHAPTLRQGTATLAHTQYPVIAGKRLPVQVIGDWRDAESDPVVAEALSPGSSVDGLGRLNILAPDRPGPQSVKYSVDDGHNGTATGQVSLQVIGVDGKVKKPETQPDVIRGVVGKPVQIEPLGNDIAGADPTEPDAKMRLVSQVAGPGNLQTDTNLDTGVVTITGTAAGTYQLTYAAQVGSGISPGRIRVDVDASADPNAPPVAVPDSATLRDQTPVLTDVLSNDYSPRADVLVTSSVAVTSDNAWLRPSIYKGRWVRIEALEPSTTGSKPRLGTVKYTVSDGSKSSTGEISVQQKPPLNNAVPIVQDDVAVVRAQDTVTIPAVENDSMAEGIPLVLDPASVKVLGGGKQTAFASGNLVRYVPDVRNPSVEKVVTIEYAVYPIGMKDRAQTGRISVTVKPLPTPSTPNRPPVARSFSTSVVAGEPLTITVPTSGVDPDGDTVTVAGIVGKGGGDIDLSLGRVTQFGASTIKYEAYPRAAGTEVLNYEVVDRFGATSTGFIRIGVVQPGDPQPPVAVEDEVRAAPGKHVTIDVTENDLIARGDSIDLSYEDLNEPDDLKAWKVDRGATTFSTTVPETSAGVRQATYGITNGLFDPSRATVAVVPVAKWINPPTAVDDTAKPRPGETSTDVDALANDRDIDGDPGSIKITSVLSPDAEIVGGKVRVKVLDHPHTVPYVITDADGATAMALIFVPTGNDGAPFVVNGALIEMGKDSTKSVKLSDYVKSPRDKHVAITSADTLSSSPLENVTVQADGRDGLRLTSSGGYVGPAAVMLEVSDQESIDQKDFKTAYVSIPVQVGPKVPLLRCPDYAIQVTAAGRARNFDIPTLCHAWLPPGMTVDDVTFDAKWEPAPKGVDLKQDGSGGSRVTVKADRDAPGTTNGKIRIQARGASEVSHVAVTVLGLARNAQQAGTGGGPEAGPPRLRPFKVTGLKAGSSQTINLRGYLDSPLEKPQCAIQTAAVPPASGLSVSHNGCDLTIRAAGTARGSANVDVSVWDAPGRAAAGRGTVDILGRPDAPTGVSAVADRVNGGTARVSWSPPAFDGGTPVTGYTVITRGAGGSGPRSCSASPCTIEGLQDGQKYWFKVTATNGVGDSPPSAEAGPVTPDTLPNAVNGVRMVSRGDGSLVVGWSPPAEKGSPVTNYDVRVTDTTSGSIRTGSATAPTTQTSITGLNNNHEQSVQVRAKNALGWGPFGSAVSMQSAGTPPAVPAPTVTMAGPGPAESSATMTISWNSVSPNGPALVKYTVYRKVSGGAWTSVGTTSPSTRTMKNTVPYDGRTYSYTVTATNGANKESAKANSTSKQSVAPPVTPGTPTVSVTQANKSANVKVSLKDSRGSGYTQLKWQSSAGASGTISCGCAENSTKSFTASNLGISSQRIRVQVYNGNIWSSWSAYSASFQPYGPTLAPTSAGSSANGKTITYKWNWASNGQPATGFQIYRGGTRLATVSAGARSWSHTESSYSTTYSVNVYAVAQTTGRSSGAATISGRTDDPPTPTIFNVRKGPNRVATSGNGSCLSSPGCPTVLFDVNNFPPNTNWSITVFTGGGSAGSSAPVVINGSGNGYSWSGWVVVANGNGPVSVRLTRGGESHTSQAVSW